MDSKNNNTSKKLTAAQARWVFIAIWKKCELGVKERVKKAHSYRMIHYMLKTEDYSKTDNILAVIETIKKEVKAIKDKADTMNDEVLETLERAAI